MRKIGIFSGTFDPIHHGHLTFAKVAADEVSLDKVYFLIEPEPRNKQAVTDYNHRQAMLQLAIKNQPALDLLEVSTKQFDLEHTLPELQSRFNEDQLYLLMGSEVNSLSNWPGIDKVSKLSFIIAARSDHSLPKVPSHIQYRMLRSELPAISSSQIRNNPNKATKLTVQSVAGYIHQHKLYN